MFCVAAVRGCRGVSGLAVLCSIMPHKDRPLSCCSTGCVCPVPQLWAHAGSVQDLQRAPGGSGQPLALVPAPATSPGPKGLPRALLLSSSCSLTPALGLPLGLRLRAPAHHRFLNVLCRDICCIPVSMLGQRDKGSVGEVRGAWVQSCPHPCSQDLGTLWEGWAEQHQAPCSPGGDLHFANSPTPCPACCCPCLLHVKLPGALGWQITTR